MVEKVGMLSRAQTIFRRNLSCLISCSCFAKEVGEVEDVYSIHFLFVVMKLSWSCLVNKSILFSALLGCLSSALANKVTLSQQDGNSRVVIFT